MRAEPKSAEMKLFEACVDLVHTHVCAEFGTFLFSSFASFASRLPAEMSMETFSKSKAQEWELDNCRGRKWALNAPVRTYETETYTNELAQNESESER